MQLGKFNSERDSLLHYMCVSEWANESFGSVEAPTGFVWRISNNWEEVKPENTEITSVLEEWFEQQGDVEDTPEFRRSLVGHFILIENDQGFVSVTQFPNEHALMEEYTARLEDFGIWDTQTEPCEWFVNNGTVPAWCCNTHMYDGTNDFPSTGEHPETCPFVED
jgi:hypothetical protein